MPRNKLITGNSLDEQMMSIERTLQQLALRSNKVVGVQVPPALMSVYVEKPVDGIVHRQLFPCAGEISNIIYVIEELPEKVVNVDIEICFKHLNNSFEKVTVSGKKNVQSKMINKKITAGTQLIIRLANPNIDCGKIWLSGMFIMDIAHTKIQAMLIDEIEAAYERLQKNIAAEQRAAEQKESSIEFKSINSGTKSTNGKTSIGVTSISK